jgi:hypothetical protein
MHVLKDAHLHPATSEVHDFETYRFAERLVPRNESSFEEARMKTTFSLDSVRYDQRNGHGAGIPGTEVPPNFHFNRRVMVYDTSF